MEVEFYNRYLASWPTQYIGSSSGVRLYKFILSFSAITLCFISSSISEPIVPWPYISIGGQVANILPDDSDGSIFVTVGGDLLKYTNELKLVPATSNRQTKAIETDTDSSVNKLLIALKKQQFLFTCWQSKGSYLRCTLSQTNSSARVDLTWSNGNKGFKTEPTDQIRGLVSQIDGNIIIAASRSVPINSFSDSNSSQIPYLPSIGYYKITTDQRNPSSLLIGQNSVLSYRPQLDEFNLLYDHVYLFEYNGHTHFILNDIRKPLDISTTKEAEHKVRLARVCNNDTSLTSYTEISLICVNQENVVAKYAYLDTSEADTNLYVVFETVVDPLRLSKKYEVKSSLCSYSMLLVEDNFKRATLDCNSGHQSSNLLSKLYPDQPPLCQRNTSPVDAWCTSKLNPYIDGTSYRYEVREDYSLMLDGIDSINFFHTLKQGPGSKGVLFFGTESGHLIKMTHDGDLIYTIDLIKHKIKNYLINETSKFKSISSDPKLSKSSRYSVSLNRIYAVSAGRLNQLDANACYYYTNCQACLANRDLLECAWCGNSCSRKQDCGPENRYTIVCPPVIKSFHPKSGPTTGWTRLKIEGQNFGTSKGNRTVKLNDQDCEVDNEASTDQMIECLTKPVDRPMNVSLTLKVLDESTFIYSNGSTSSPDLFAYAKVKVYGLSPASGSQLGGNPVEIFGENLDAGSNRTIYLGDSKCKINSPLQSSKLTCITKAWQGTPANESAVLQVFIDGSQQSLVPRASFKEHNLTTQYLYINDTATNDGDNMKPLQSKEAGSFYPLMIIIILTVISVILIYLAKVGKLPKFKVKLPPYDSPTATKNDSAFSFRNPQNHRSNDITNSMNGLLMSPINSSIRSSNYFIKSDQFEQDQPLMNTFLDNETLAFLLQQKILIDRSRLTLGHVLGSGQFGRVYKGFLKIDETGEHTAVAVKTLHNRSAWDDALDNRAFLEEGLMMKDFEHENVLTLVGVTFERGGLPMVITPFMLYGDLRSYISDEASSPTVKELINLGTQVARGMAYLSNLKFVHRDLAARNCMLDENLTVKVADFGLSRDIYERDYVGDNSKTKLPVKWMAIESLEKCIYNTKTDVWSYGVLLWELMTRGVVPYPDVDNFDLFSYLKEGRRMLRPRYCPLILYNIMLSCWLEIPANRPTFDELVDSVSDVISQLKIAKDGQQKVSRDETYCDLPSKENR